MNILRGLRRDRLYRDWAKHARLPLQDIPQPKPAAKITGIRKLPPNLLIYILLGAALLLILVGLSLLLLT